MMITNKGRKKLGIYVHIPFCIRKCRYCGFLSFENTGEDIQKEYIRALKAEISVYGKEYPSEYLVDTLFIGGGTPSSIYEGYIYDLIDTVCRYFSMADDCEITIETNPGTLTSAKLSAYRQSGINRLSMGVQTLDDRVLENIGRIHRAKDVEENFYLARMAGFLNINMDLMFSLPGQTYEALEKTLLKVRELNPEHVSFYSLQLEEGTEFYRMYEEGIFRETSDEEDRRMYSLCREYLREHGYIQYEISNSARKGYHSRHNMKYWNMEDYLGFGAGASSFFSGIRFKNTSDMKEYIRTAAEAISLSECTCIKGSGAVCESYVNSTFDNASEFVFTGLRKTEGISLDEFKKFTEEDFFSVFNGIDEKIGRWQEEGLVILKDGKLKLTPNGIDISNSILSEFV